MNLRNELNKKSKFLRCADLEDQPRVYTVEGVTREEVGQERELKYLLHFQDAGIKPLILNATNSDTLIGLLGPETSDWDGKRVELFPSETSFQGKRVDCVRVRAPRAPTRPALVQESADGIPF